MVGPQWGTPDPGDGQDRIWATPRSLTRWKQRRPLPRDKAATSSSFVGSSPVGAGQRRDTELDRAFQVEVWLEAVTEALADRVGIAAEHGNVSVVDHCAVVENMEHLVVFGLETNLGDEDLDLHRLHLVGEDVAEDLGVLVGQRPGVDVVARVLEPLEVGSTDARHPKLIELVVLADAGECDAVVDLTDLAKRLRRILGDDRDAVRVPDCHQCPTAGDALAGIVGAILHDLFGSDVERLTHRALQFRGDRFEAGFELVVTDRRPAVSGDCRHDRVDAAQSIWATRCRIGVGRLPQAAHRQIDRSVAAHVGLETDLDHGTGVQAARAGGDVLALLVATTREVVGEQTPDFAPQVPSCEQGHHDHALHRSGQIASDHHRQLIGLALQAEGGAFDLLVVLEL